MSGLPAIEFKQRRQRMLGMMSPGSIAIIPGAGLQRRNRDIQYQFRQDSDLYYLTGFVEPTALLVLLPGREHGETILFCAERDPVAERWDGERMGPERAAQMLGVDDAFPYGDMGDILPGLLEGRSRIYMTMGEYVDIDNLMVGWLGELRKREPGGLVIPGEIVALKNYLHELRLYKSKREQKLMKRAASITCEAHKRAMRQCAPGMTEHQLDAELTYEFMRHGARCAAYPSIIGSGANACVMHYVENNATIEKGDLVLIDAGCEYEHYAADVTRTFPATGKFTKPQKDIYAIVLQANRDAIGACRPGEHFNAPHEAAVRALVRGLVKLGLLEGEVDEIIADESYKSFCPHKTSHWLGIDVHDVGDYRIDERWRDFEPGMVLTIEPGIYIPTDESTTHLPAKYRGIGVRIEDDVLIGKQGPEVLTEDVPKDIDAIETLMAEAVA